MDRRKLLKLIAAATGCALIGIDRAFADASYDGAAMLAPSTFGAGDIALLDEIAETIIPKTATPGAKDAAVGAFIGRYADACYEPAQLVILKAGMGTLNERMRSEHGRGFLDASEAQRKETLLAIDREAKAVAAKEGEPPHYFTLMKQLTILGFFSSEPGITQVLRYRPIPGKYKGRINYIKGEASWA